MGSEHGIGSRKNPRTGSGADPKNSNSLVASKNQSRTVRDSDTNVNIYHTPSSSGSYSDKIFEQDSKALPGLGASDVASSSASLVSCVNHQSTSLPFLSPAQLPPRLVMDRNDGYDPGRIPASIFSSKDLNPIDWSAASNDSLFSINIGNSFSTDQLLMMSGDQYKSLELCNPEHSKINGSTELVKVRQGSSKGTDSKKKIQGARNSKISLVSDGQTKKILKSFDETEELNVNKEFGKFSSLACPSCHCCNCSSAFGCCLWPSCFFKCLRWPGCCKWLSCHSCCCKLPSCSCKCPSWPSFQYKCRSWSWVSKCSTWSSHCCKFPTWPSKL